MTPVRDPLIHRQSSSGAGGGVGVRARVYYLTGSLCAFLYVDIFFPYWFYNWHNYKYQFCCYY